MRKLISGVLVVLILFNFMLCNNAYAESEREKTKADEVYSEEQVETGKDLDAQIIEEGTAPRTQKSSTKVQLNSSSVGVSAIGMIAGILARVINVLIALQVDLLMGFLTHGQETSNEGEENPFWFSIDRCVFNRVSLFNIDYFDVSTGSTENETYTVGSGEYEVAISKSQGNNEIKKSVIQVYYICRIVALILSLLVLIYIGIRMAISTVASDQAKYKKMLISWVESIAILFLMLYIIAFIILISDQLTSIFYTLRCTILNDPDNQKYEIFETTIRHEAWAGLFTRSGFDLAIWSIIYWCLLILEVKFFFMYARRLLMVGLLITVSPLIIITYSMDKAGDGQAQAFGNWLKEFIMAVLIQPLHALIYLVFVFTANAIAASSPLVALALLLSMTTVEKMVKVVFNMRGLEAIKEIKFLKKGGK